VTGMVQARGMAPLRVGWSGGVEPPFLPKMRGVVQEHTSYPRLVA
jgi:hypothetical protein